MKSNENTLKSGKSDGQPWLTVTSPGQNENM
jgi:hypothetical protein